MPGHEKAVLQGRHRDERPPSDKPVDVVLILIDVKRTGRRGGGTHGSRKSREGRTVELGFTSAGFTFFLHALIGDKTLRQVPPTGIIIPIIKQFSEHIRNASIKP